MDFFYNRLVVFIFTFLLCMPFSTSLATDNLASQDFPYISKILGVGTETIQPKKAYEITSVFTEQQILEFVRMLHDGDFVHITYSAGETVFYAKLLNHEGKYYYFISKDNFFLSDENKNDKNIINDVNSAWKTPKDSDEDVAKIIFLTLINETKCSHKGRLVGCGEDKPINFVIYSLAKDPISHPSSIELLNEVFSPDKEYTTALDMACYMGDLESVEFFISKKVDVNKVMEWDGDTPLDTAIQTKHPEIAKMLIAAGAKQRVSTPVVGKEEL